MQGVAIISDTAGKGKSTILTRFGHLLKQQKPNTWVLRSNLNDKSMKLLRVTSMMPEVRAPNPQRDSCNNRCAIIKWLITQ